MDSNESRQTRIKITAGAWIGIASLALTMVLALFAAAGWIISRIDSVEARIDTRIDGLDTRIDGLDTRIDALAVEIATMRGQLDILTQTHGQEDTRGQ